MFNVIVVKIDCLYSLHYSSAVLFSLKKIQFKTKNSFASDFFPKFRFTSICFPYEFRLKNFRFQIF